MTINDPEERSALAGEYVLGSLDPDARMQFEQQLLSDQALQAEVYAWQDRLLGLALRVSPVQPHAGLWLRIEEQLAGPRPQVASAATPIAAATATTEAANDPLWQRLQRWRIGGGLAIAASLVLATLLVFRSPAPSADAARYLAVLQAPADQSAGWIVEATAGGSLRLVPIAGGDPVPSGKSLQFWTKAEGAAGPTSLGLINAGQVTEIPVGQLPTLEARQLFELTLEPEGGSTIGRPTGPIVFVGRTVLL